MSLPYVPLFHGRLRWPPQAHPGSCSPPEQPKNGQYQEAVVSLLRRKRRTQLKQTDYNGDIVLALRREPSSQSLEDHGSKGFSSRRKHYLLLPRFEIETAVGSSHKSRPAVRPGLLHILHR